MPPPDSTGFALRMNQLHKSVGECKTNNSLVTGYLHKDRSRVSINYTDGGIFTFELKPKQEYHGPSTWQGQIAEIKDFKMTNFVIAKGSDDLTAQGKDSRGNFIVTGKREPKTRVWKGFFV